MTASFGYRTIIEEIANLGWEELSEAELSAVARAYYFFSVQFRENLQVACQLHPGDPQLAKLLLEECETANLSPWPDVAIDGEKLDHDEFMRRVLQLSAIDPAIQRAVDAAGHRYLSKIRSVDDRTRAISITTYEDGGLESVFTAMLGASNWNTPLLQGFQHFLRKHIAFDSAEDGGHGSLIRHLAPDDSVSCLWTEFRDLLVVSIQAGHAALPMPWQASGGRASSVERLEPIPMNDCLSP
jgi:hypothetical protein